MSVEPRFDELIHPSTRLSIVALLAAADWAEFPFVRDALGLSDSALSKQFSTLEEAGYITIDRPVSDSRRRVRVRLTDAGRRAFRGHVAALHQIVGSPTAGGPIRTEALRSA
jgi:DNA-binding MarR family transcriptional regulator